MTSATKNVKGHECLNKTLWLFNHIVYSEIDFLMWILLVKTFPTVVLELPQLFWFLGGLIFGVFLLGVQSSCTNHNLE